MTSRQKRALQRQFESQVNEERNGAPVPPQVAARMTKPKPTQLMYQVAVDWVNEDGSKEIVAASPAVDQKDCADMFCAMIESQLGRLPMMKNPRVLPLFAASQGVI